MKPQCSGCPVLSNALFRSLSSQEIERFTCVFLPTHYRRNQILFFEEGAAQHLFALRSGMAKMVKPLENGKERIVRVLLPGDIFGLEALCHSTYPLTCVVLQESEICSVSRDKFLAFLRANSDIALKMIQFLVEEATQVRRQITSMSFKDAQRRLATFLLSLISADRPSGSGPCRLTLPLSGQEIGELLELSPETVSRAWAGLRRAGLVDKRGRMVVIQDLAGLENLAQR